MEIKFRKINPTGNITLIAETPVLRESQAAVAAKLMALVPDSEQVGFIEKPSEPSAAFRLQMMGGEFCGNATISAAALYMSERGLAVGEKADVTLEVSGSEKLMTVSVECKGENLYRGTLNMPLPEACSACILSHDSEKYSFPLVRMPGICHAIVSDSLRPSLAEKAVAEWCKSLNCEALGLMFYEPSEGLLRPFVYVASTSSAVWESSCASGSCAVAAYESLSRVEDVSLSLKQPGGTLTVRSACANGSLSSITLSGNAEVCGGGLALIDT